MFDCLFSYSLIIIIIIIQILFNERHHSTFDSKPKECDCRGHSEYNIIEIKYNRIKYNRILAVIDNIMNFIGLIDDRNKQGLN